MDVSWLCLSHQLQTSFRTASTGESGVGYLYAGIKNKVYTITRTFLIIQPCFQSEPIYSKLSTMKNLVKLYSTTIKFTQLSSFDLK